MNENNLEPVKLQGIGHCAIAVTNIETSARFYREVLGFDLLEHEDNTLEIYYEKSNWREIFEAGRGDEDLVFSFDDPAPEWE